MTTVLAHVRRILTGHTDRALLHAVDGDGLEYKIEVPAAAVRGAESEQLVMMVSWSLLALPKVATAVTPASVPKPQAPEPKEAPQPTVRAAQDPDDATFAALMARMQTKHNAAPATPAAPVTTSPATATTTNSPGAIGPPSGSTESTLERQLAAMMGRST